MRLIQRAMAVFTLAALGALAPHAASASTLTTRKVLAGFNSSDSLKRLHLYGSGVSMELNTQSKYIH